MDDDDDDGGGGDDDDDAFSQVKYLPQGWSKFINGTFPVLPVILIGTSTSTQEDISL